MKSKSESVDSVGEQELHDSPEMTEHALTRMAQRGLHESDVGLALRYGRKIHSRRALFHVIGRKEINRFSNEIPEIKELDGVQVVTDGECETVVTVYRNHDLRAIRPNKRKHRHLH